MPITSAGSTPAAAIAAGTAVRSTSTVVVGDLQRPVRRQRSAGARQGVVEDAVRVLVHRRAELGAVGDPHDHGAAGQGAEVDADGQGAV